MITDQDMPYLDELSHTAWNKTECQLRYIALVGSITPLLGTTISLTFEAGPSYVFDIKQ